MIEKLNDQSLLLGVHALAERDEELAGILAKYGPPPLWERAEGFHTLIHIILEQQVSLASAKAAFERLQGAIGKPQPAQFLSLSDAAMKSFGFSRQKTRYGRALAHAIQNGEVDLSLLSEMPSQSARDQLIKIKGIGPWTADIYLLMALGRPDIWPLGDLALVVAIQHLKGLQQRPTQEEVSNISTHWRPYRAVAARMLWHFYLSERT